MAAKRPDFEREMELAGLEPATSWVQSRIGGSRAISDSYESALFAGTSRLPRSRAKPRFHLRPREAGLHMGCNRRCRNQQQRMKGARIDAHTSRGIVENDLPVQVGAESVNGVR
jgi:hypothetical protein